MSSGRPRDDSGAPGAPSLTTLIKAGPSAVRQAADLWWRTGRWTLDTSWRVSSRLGQAVVRGENLAEVLEEGREEALEYVRRALGVMDIVAASATNVAMPDLADRDKPEVPDNPTEELRRRGAELLRRSADVEYEEDAHPAFERILGSMAPDEARILRVLCLKGAQPSVDVRGASGIRVQMELIAPGLQMIGQEAGVRYLDRVPSYLNNLYRLGLIWFSREPLSDPRDYAVLEAQPEVQEALAEASRSKTVRRSIHLTPFGQDFCAVCLPDPGEQGSPSGQANGRAQDDDREQSRGRRRRQVRELSEADQEADEIEERQRAEQREREREVEQARGEEP
jgi:Abortive infection alpha